MSLSHLRPDWQIMFLALFVCFFLLSPQHQIHAWEYLVILCVYSTQRVPDVPVQRGRYWSMAPVLMPSSQVDQPLHLHDTVKGKFATFRECKISVDGHCDEIEVVHYISVCYIDRESWVLRYASNVHIYQGALHVGLLLPLPLSAKKKLPKCCKASEFLQTISFHPLLYTYLQAPS